MICHCSFLVSIYVAKLQNHQRSVWLITCRRWWRLELAATLDPHTTSVCNLHVHCDLPLLFPYMFVSIEIADSSKKCVIDYLQKVVTAWAGCDPRSTYSCFNFQPSRALWSAIALWKKSRWIPINWVRFHTLLFWQQDLSKSWRTSMRLEIEAGVRCKHVDDYIHLQSKSSVSSNEWGRTHC